MRELGKRIQKEQQLSDEIISFLVIIAYAILRAFTKAETPCMSDLATELGVSRTTLYRYVRLGVELLVWLFTHRKGNQDLIQQVSDLTQQLNESQEAQKEAKAEAQLYARKSVEMQEQISSLESELETLREQWKLAVDRLIVVLKMSGRCTVRSIKEVLNYGLGTSVSVGYVQGVLNKASENAKGCWQSLLAIIPLSGALGIDEIFLKEAGKRIYGILVVDPITGLILHLERVTERTSGAITKVLTNFKNNYPKVEEKITICLTDMYKGYLAPIPTLFKGAVHQFCWFHINCFHIGATVKRSEKAVHKIQKELDDFDKKNKSLDEAGQLKRQTLQKELDEATRLWIGTQRFQRMLRRLIYSTPVKLASEVLERLIRISSRSTNPYLCEMGTFLASHQPQLLTFISCLEEREHTLRRFSRSKNKWIEVTKRWAVPITNNAAEHVFRGLRRYTKNMEQFSTQEGTERFFDLFLFFSNIRTLREGKKAGKSLLAAAHVNLIKVFGTDDPYTILGFPPARSNFQSIKKPIPPSIPSQIPHSSTKILPFPHTKRLRKNPPTQANRSSAKILPFPHVKRHEKTVQPLAA